MINIEQLTKQAKELEDKLNELKLTINNIKEEGIDNAKEEDTEWQPKAGERYYCVTTDGEVFIATWTNDLTDFGRLNLCDVFKTKEEAEKEAKIIKVRVQLKRLSKKSMRAKGLKFAGDNLIYLQYIPMSNKVWTCSVDIILNPYPFSTKEDAQSAIKEIGEEDLKLYFGVEE